MSLGIRHKLIIAFTAIALLVTVLAFVAMLLSFRSGFLQYLNDARFNSIEQLSQRITAEVETKKQWQALTQNPRQWQRFIRQSMNENTDGFVLPPPRHKPKPSRDQTNSNDHRPPSNRRSPRGSGLFQARYFLLDHQKQAVYRQPKSIDELLLSPIRINDKIVGYVGLNRLKNLNNLIDNNADKIFVANQTRYFIGIAVAACAIAVMVAFFMSSWMVAPIQRLVKAMSALIQRDYSVSVEYKASDEIGSLVASFNQLAKALADHEQSQQRWIADISHELRTPLSILKGELEALQDGVRPLTHPSIDSLHEELLRLQRIVDDLHQLTLSDLGALRYRFEEINIIEVIEDVFKQHESSLKQSQLSYSIHTDNSHEVSVLADRGRVYQLLSNLLQNSLRYTDPNGEVRVNVQSVHDAILLHWEDSSPGVAVDALNRLFDRLYREEVSRNRKKGGSGLGLSICRSIVQAHGGDITAQHSPLGGVKVIIRLPLKNK